MVWEPQRSHTKAIADLAQNWSNQSEATSATGKRESDGLSTVQPRVFCHLIDMTNCTYTIASNETRAVEITWRELFHVSPHGLRSSISGHSIVMVCIIPVDLVFIVFSDCTLGLHRGCTVRMKLIFDASIGKLSKDALKREARADCNAYDLAGF